MNAGEAAIAPRTIQSIEPEDGGSLVRLACGHLLWCALEPDDFRLTLSRNSMYCASCVNDYLQAVRDGKQPRN